MAAIIPNLSSKTRDRLCRVSWIVGCAGVLYLLNAKGFRGCTSSTDIARITAAVSDCLPISLEEKVSLRNEIAEYEKSTKFKNKIAEVLGEISPGAHHVAIAKYLINNVLQPGWSILELGCAAGMMLQMVQHAYKAGLGNHGKLVGVELVKGWVDFAQRHHHDMSVYEGDVTDFRLPNQEVFDFVMINDVAEHIQTRRYGCFFATLAKVTKQGSIVYYHTPTPQAQVADNGQYYENVLPHHYLVLGMALKGFELVTFEHDLDTDCGSRHSTSVPRQVQGAKCFFNGYPKYYHAVFRKVADPRLLKIS